MTAMILRIVLEAAAKAAIVTFAIGVFVVILAASLYLSTRTPGNDDGIEHTDLPL